MTFSDEEKLSTNRVQTGLLSSIEKKALLWMAPKLPQGISPDMLTFFGLLGLILCGLSYYFTFYHQWFLILASVGLVINWLGDSLDGTVARIRNKQRPRYGYYIDHLVDAFGIACLIFGLAYSHTVSQPFVWLVLALFFIASINTYLATNSVHVFKISYMKVSTTEARVLLVGMNTVLIFAKSVTVLGFRFYWLDVAAALVALFLFFIILHSAWKNLRKLNREEKAQWK